MKNMQHLNESKGLIIIHGHTQYGEKIPQCFLYLQQLFYQSTCADLIYHFSSLNGLNPEDLYHTPFT